MNTKHKNVLLFVIKYVSFEVYFLLLNMPSLRILIKIHRWLHFGFFSKDLNLVVFALYDTSESLHATHVG